MTKKEKEYLQITFKDKKEEITKCLNHYASINDTENIHYFRGQLNLLNELEKEYFQNYLK